jgi:hypothetical protein
MALRDWVKTVAAGVFACVAPACMRTLDVGKAVGPREPPILAKGAPEPLAIAESASPYNPIAGIPMPPEAEPAFHRVAGPERTSAGEDCGLPGFETEVKADMAAAANSETGRTARPREEPALVAALRCFLDKRPGDAMERLKGYDQTNQELLLVLLPMVARLSEGGLGKASPQEVNTLLESVNSVLVPLRARAPVTINKMCFCKEIRGFGDYEPLPDFHRFRPGDRVRIYVELQNCTSQPRTDASGQVRHVINLVSSAEIKDYRGNKVWPEDIVFQRQGANASLTLRHDYFDNYGFWVPEIPPGSYTLWIQVEDRGTNPPRTVKGSLDFHVGPWIGEGKS